MRNIKIRHLKFLIPEILKKKNYLKLYILKLLLFVLWFKLQFFITFSILEWRKKNLLIKIRSITERYNSLASQWGLIYILW